MKRITCFYHHEGHEDNEGFCACLIHCSLVDYKSSAIYLQALHALHGKKDMLCC